MIASDAAEPTDELTVQIGFLLEMATGHVGGRIAVGSLRDGITYAELGRRCRRAAARFAADTGDHVVLVDENSLAVPVCLFGAALAGKPFVPVSYRLADRDLRRVLERVAPATVVAGGDVALRIDGIGGIEILDRDALLDAIADPGAPEAKDWGSAGRDGVAVLLFTSGTTGPPKAAVLRHRNLTSYILGTCELGSADAQDSAVVSVPPYHVASVSSVLSNTYRGRRVVFLESFEPARWVETVRAESVTHAMVVPTMLRRILDVLDDEGLPSLRSLAYGGGPMPRSVVERALDALPDVGLVNAYGLTETSSTISVLGPDDHRAAMASDVPEVRARLASVGRPVPGVEVSIRDGDGNRVPPGVLGRIWVHGEQVSGEYLGEDAPTGGWFDTRDDGWIDVEGYLFVAGRADDVIVRGGENLSPGEIETVLEAHDAVIEAAVVGVADDEWGECVVAAVVRDPNLAVSEDELRRHVRDRLRSARTPERIVFRRSLPRNELGKLLRTSVRSDLESELAPDAL